jgi:cell wall-associated NlpC family hydrolase
VKTRRLAPIALAIVVLAGAGLLTSCTKQVAVVNAARDQIGMPYVTGGESPAEGGFDCSGLTYFAWKQVGVTLPRSSAAQYSWATKITKDKLQPGDLVFYSSAGTTGTVSHVALYAGDGKIVQAHKPGVALSEDDLATWWKGHLVGYGRVPASANPA